jgi:quercetin dioxygenase-like cupin family protein
MTTPNPYTLIPNVDELLSEIQTDSITSRTFLKNADLNAIIFGFDAGQSLSEHTSSKMAIIHILEGDATITLGDEVFHAQKGTWIHMPPHLKHSIYADTPLKMLLLMFTSHEE